MTKLRCGHCGEELKCELRVDGSLVKADIVPHECGPLPTGRKLGEWTYLEPDKETLKHCTYVLLKPCPFCGSNAGPPITRLREDTGIYQTLVSCSADTRCRAEVTYNGYTRKEAFDGAVRLWEDRRPLKDRGRALTLDEETL